MFIHFRHNLNFSFLPSSLSFFFVFFFFVFFFRFVVSIPVFVQETVSLPFPGKAASGGELHSEKNLGKVRDDEAR